MSPAPSEIALLCGDGTAILAAASVPPVSSHDLATMDALRRYDGLDDISGQERRYAVYCQRVSVSVAAQRTIGQLWDEFEQRIGHQPSVFHLSADGRWLWLGPSR